MSSDQKDSGTDVVMDHAYDGIQEYDNPLPTWWLVTFFATIIFSFNYFIHNTFADAPTQSQELQAEMEALPKATEQEWNENDLLAIMTSPENQAAGKAAYTAKCSSCHGAEGQGMIGPNLTDSHWLHGQGKRADLVKIINKGVPEKGMPAWADMMAENEIIAVAGFIFSLRGSKPANAKAPQGVEVKE